MTVASFLKRLFNRLLASGLFTGRLSTKVPFVGSHSSPAGQASSSDDLCKISPSQQKPPGRDRAKDSEELAKLSREIRGQRKFSIAEAIGREGGSFLQGESAIPRPLRAAAEVNRFIGDRASDPAGALATTLQTWASDDIRLSRQLDTPLVALAQIVESLLSEPTTFCEFARQVAIAHAQMTGDRPYFHPLNGLPHPAAAEAKVTHEAIKTELTALYQRLLCEH